MAAANTVIRMSYAAVIRNVGGRVLWTPPFFGQERQDNLNVELQRASRISGGPKVPDSSATSRFARTLAEDPLTIVKRHHNLKAPGTPAARHPHRRKDSQNVQD